MKKTLIKKIRRVVLIVFASLIGLVLLLYGLLWLPPVQQKIKDIVLKEVMKMTNNQISIGKLHFRPFNKLKLDRVYASDFKGDTLLYAETLSASFDLFKILKDELLIKGVELDNFLININKDSIEGDFNFQFFIDAFASEPDTTSTSSMVIQIHDVKIKNGRINYDILSEPEGYADVFDFNHIRLYDVNAEVDLSSIDIEKLDARLSNLSLKERSGLVVEEMGVKLKSKNKRIMLDDFVVRLPNSQLSIPRAWVDYSGGKLSELMDKGSFQLQLGQNSIAPKDLTMFYLPLKKLKDDLVLEGEVSGTLPEVNIGRLTASYGKGIKLNTEAFMKDINHWDKSMFSLNIKTFSITSNAIDEVLYFLSDNEPITLLVNTGNIDLKGKLTGSLPNMKVNLDAHTGRGSLNLNGSGGYIADTGAAHFDADLGMKNFDIETLLQDSVFGQASLHLKAQGGMAASGVLNVAGDLNISRFDYNRYTYNNIYAKGSMQGDSLSLYVHSEDANIPADITARANIGKRNPYVGVQVRMDSVYIDTLNFLPGFKDVYLTSTIKGRIEGFNPERMNVDFGIDSLNLTSDKGSFFEPRLRIAYMANEQHEKELDISSRLIKGNASGAFTFAGLKEAIVEAFPVLFEDVKPNPRLKDTFAQDLKFRFDVREANALGEILQFGEIPDSAVFMGQFTNRDENLELLLSAYTQYFEADTLQMSMLASNRDNNLSLILNVDNKSKLYDVDGSLDAEIALIPVRGGIPDMDIKINPSVIVVNDTYFDLRESSVEVREKRYTVNDFTIDHGENEYIKVNGIVSTIPEDSITLDISRFQIGTLLGAMKTTDVPISGEANGQVVAKRLLTTPVVLTRNFAVNDIVFAENDIGDLRVSTVYSTERKGIVLRATLDHEQHEQSLITGLYRPEQDSLTLNAKIRDIHLDWLQNMVGNQLYGLAGSFNADIKAEGTLSNPVVNGYAYFDKAKIGVSMLNTLYTTSDSIFITPEEVSINRFRLFDENEKTLTARGNIKYKNFTNFVPNISLFMNDFMVMNNMQQTDSMFYGNLKLNGRLSITESNKEWLLSGDISPSANSSIMVNIPTSAGTTARRHTSITFVNSEGVNLDELAEETERLERTEFSFPMRINIAMTLYESMTMGAVYNPATGDYGRVNGSGNIRFEYDLSSSWMNIVGDYTVKSGTATLSIANVTKKTFQVQEGGKLAFRGDPLATQFDVTALYNLRADLANLDQGFETLMGGSTRVPVVCLVSVKGSLDKMDNMDIVYDIELPDESDDIQRLFGNVLYTDNDKIVQFAYLLALGNFMDNSGGSDVMDNLLSSGISAGLNAVFSNILADNWSIDTNVNSTDGNFDEMDVNISTNLLNNRLTVTSTLGYHADANARNDFTGDFTIEYKLTPTGNVVLKAFHITNTDYFEKAPYTQGVGIVYKRSEKTFNELFQSVKKSLSFGGGGRRPTPPPAPAKEESEEISNISPQPPPKEGE